MPVRLSKESLQAEYQSRSRIRNVHVDVLNYERCQVDSDWRFSKMTSLTSENTRPE